MKRPGGFDGDSREEVGREPARREPRVRERKVRERKSRERGGSARSRAERDGRPTEVTEPPQPNVSPAESLPKVGADAPVAGIEGGVDAGENVGVGGNADAEGNAENSVVGLREFAERDQSEVAERPQGEMPGDVPTKNRVRSAERALARARSSVRRRERRETKRFTSHLRRRRRNWLIAAGAVLALAAFVAIGTLSPLMAVRDVQISGATRVSVDKLETALARFDGVPLTLVSEQEVHRALEPFPLIQRYSIERIPPHTLHIRIEERDPVIAVDKDGKYELLDPAGVLVATAEEIPAGVPLAEGPTANPSTPGFTAAGSVVRDLPEDIRERLVAVSASSAQDVELTLDDGTAVVWGEASDTQEKAVVLRAMLEAVPDASTIDVSAPETPVFE